MKERRQHCLRWTFSEISIAHARAHALSRSPSLRRIDRMIALSSAHMNRELLPIEAINGQLFVFARQEMPHRGARPEFPGGQLFSGQQVDDFLREMKEWISDTKNGGGCKVATIKFQKIVAVLNEDGKQKYKEKSVAVLDADGKQKYKEILRSVFINRQDSKGNTALHLAVVKQQSSVIEWLLQSQNLRWAEPSMMILNGDNLTPFTLAARLGSASMLNQLMEMHEITAWEFGSG